MREFNNCFKDKCNNDDLLQPNDYSKIILTKEIENFYEIYSKYYSKS